MQRLYEGVVSVKMEHELKQVVAELFEADPKAVNADFVLSTRRMQGSLARAKLDAAIRNRLGIKSRAVYSVKSYGELQNALLGATSQVSESNGSTAIESTGTNSELSTVLAGKTLGFESSLRCGIDIEMVDGFPEVDDYWKDTFYINSFSSTEIAYCSLQEFPRMHFAARWCAKEALKKCDPSYLKEDMNNMELISASDHPPILRCNRGNKPDVIPVAVSISHTPQSRLQWFVGPLGQGNWVRQSLT